MPYILSQLNGLLEKDRKRLEPHLEKLVAEIVNICEEKPPEEKVNYWKGACNYTITVTLNRVPRKLLGSWRYAMVNDVVGIIGCVFGEFYRRLAGPYEDKAIQKNGDLPEYAEMNPKKPEEA